MKARKCEKLQKTWIFSARPSISAFQLNRARRRESVLKKSRRNYDQKRPWLMSVVMYILSELVKLFLPLWFATDRWQFFGTHKDAFLCGNLILQLKVASISTGVFFSSFWSQVDKLDSVLWETIEKIPYSRLAKVRQVKTLPDLYAMCDDFDPATGELFFDKHPLVFVSILNFYRISKLHMPEDICPIGFQLRVFSSKYFLYQLDFTYKP